MANPKQPINQEIYLNVLRKMTPQQRLEQTIELTETTLQLFRQGLTQRFPGLTPKQLQMRYLECLARCHNQNF